MTPAERRQKRQTDPNRLALVRYKREAHSPAFVVEHEPWFKQAMFGFLRSQLNHDPYYREASGFDLDEIADRIVREPTGNHEQEWYKKAEFAVQAVLIELRRAHIIAVPLKR